MSKNGQPLLPPSKITSAHGPSDMPAMQLRSAAFSSLCCLQVKADLCTVTKCPLLCLVHSCCHLVLSCPQELCSLHGHIKALIHAGNEQTISFSSTMDWESLQGEAAITYDKAMHSMVIAALPLCNKGKYSSAVHFMQACNFSRLASLATILSWACVAKVCDVHNIRFVADQ